MYLMPEHRSDLPAYLSNAFAGKDHSNGDVCRLSKIEKEAGDRPSGRQFQQVRDLLQIDCRRRRWTRTSRGDGIG